jgi:phage-related protein
MSEASVWIDDVELQSLGIDVRLSSDEPMLPDVRQQSITIPGRHGAYDFGAFFDVRKFELDCVFKRQTHTDLKQQIRDFVRMFVDEFGRPKTVKLRFGDELEKYYNVKVNAGVPVERLVGLGTFTLPLVAHDPHAFKLSPSDSIYMNSNADFTSEIPFFETQTFSVIAPITLTIINEGSVAIRPHLFLEGVGRSIIVSANGKQFKISAMSGNMIEIIGETYIVKNDGVSSLSTITGDFLDLLPGENALTIYGNDLDLTLSVISSPKYI